MNTEKAVNLLLGAAVAVGFVWTQLKSLPALEQRVQGHDVRLAVLENKLSSIEDGVSFLVREKRRGSSR